MSVHTHTVSCCFSLHCWRHMGVRMHVCTGVLATREITNRCDTVSGSGFEFGLWMCLSYLSFLCLFRWFGVIFPIHHIVGSLTHGALTPPPQSRPSIRGRPQCSVSCPPTPTPLGALAFPQLAPLSTTATWPNQVSQENKEQINREKNEWDYEKKNKKRGKHTVLLLLNSSLFYSRLLYSKLCMKGGTLSVLTAANVCMPAWLNTHIPTDMRALKGRGHWAYCGHVPRLPLKCHITVLIQPVRRSDMIFSFFNSPFLFLSEPRFPFFSLIVFVYSASHSFFSPVTLCLFLLFLSIPASKSLWTHYLFSFFPPSSHIAGTLSQNKNPSEVGWHSNR